MTDMFEIIPELEALELHFRQPLTGDARNRWLVDWTRDLAEFGLEDIRRACKWWRMNGERFPKPGELIKVIRRGSAKGGGEKPITWTRPTDEEYEAMDLSEKIRQHLILAHEARRKAGPMFVNLSAPGTFKMAGRHIPREEMPEEWHRLQAVARGHDVEVARLRGFLRGGGEKTPAQKIEPPAPRLPYIEPPEIVL